MRIPILNFVQDLLLRTAGRNEARKEGLLIKFHHFSSIFINLILFDHIHDHSCHSMIFFQLSNVFIILQGCSFMFIIFRYIFMVFHSFA